jgi:hypothetical protein
VALELAEKASAKLRKRKEGAVKAASKGLSTPTSGLIFNWNKI